MFDFDFTMPDLPNAACASEYPDDHDPETFFPGVGESVKVAAAKAVCAGCPERLACLTYAQGEAAKGEVLYGIWGGLTLTERATLAKVNAPDDTPPRKKRRYTTANPAECGTRSGYAKHRRNGEQACPACLHAESHRMRDRRKVAS